ncbi:MAG TPA: hypothetical protein VL096_12070 [Pirellulaceae bacterium]|nr:hypothetical protein [Pirellulaceae bacterium]
MKNGLPEAFATGRPFWRVYTVLSSLPFRLAKGTGAGVNDTALAWHKGRWVNHWGWRHWRSVATFNRGQNFATGFATAAWSGVAGVAAIALRLVATLVASEDLVQQRTAALWLAAALGFAAASWFSSTSRFNGCTGWLSFGTAIASRSTLWLAAAMEVEQRLTAALRLAALGFAAASWFSCTSRFDGCTSRLSRFAARRLGSFAAAMLLVTRFAAAAAAIHTKHAIEQLESKTLATDSHA